MASNETDLISRLIEAVAKHVRPAVPLEIALWDTADIANYLHRAQAVVRDRIAPLPSFPKAIRLPSAKGKASPLYKATEVIAWAEKHQEKR